MKSCLFMFLILVVLIAFLGTMGLVYFSSTSLKVTHADAKTEQAEDAEK